MAKVPVEVRLKSKHAQSRRAPTLHTSRHAKKSLKLLQMPLCSTSSSSSRRYPIIKKREQDNNVPGKEKKKEKKL